MDSNVLPLVYSCSGCSSAAQLANHLALKLDRNGYAEMSCIAGVGGNVKKLVRIAQSGRPIMSIDGCPLACARACLPNHNITPDYHILLNDWGIRKEYGADFDEKDAAVILKDLQSILSTPESDNKNVHE